MSSAYCEPTEAFHIAHHSFIESLASQRSLDTTLALLQTAAAEAKEDSEVQMTK